MKLVMKTWRRAKKKSDVSGIRSDLHCPLKKNIENYFAIFFKKNIKYFLMAVTILIDEYLRYFNRGFVLVFCFHCTSDQNWAKLTK